MQRPADKVWVFDEFEPGRELAHLSIRLDASRLEGWHAVYGPSSETGNVPAGLLTAAMMEAYLKAFQPRPPGNVHVNQKLTFAGRQVIIGTQVDISVSCLSKEIRKERRWVTFGVTMRDGSHDILRGEALIIWAR